VFDLENKSAELFHTYTAFGGGGVPHYLSWSPNGEWLAFVTFHESTEDGRRPNLWIARPDGQEEVRLGTAHEPTWHPNGSQLAFNLYDVTQETFQVWLHDTVTGEQTPILPVGTTVLDWLAPTDELMQTLRQNLTTQ
jgi:Tol biopolymer transport system component